MHARDHSLTECGPDHNVTEHLYIFASYIIFDMTLRVHPS